VTKKAIAKRSTSSKSSRDARLAAVRSALTKYFLGSVATSEKFWSTNNPSLGNKSPANMVKAGKLNVLEQYVNYLRNHAQSARPKVVDKRTDERFLVLEGLKEEVVEKLKEIPASQRVIAICFEDAESYYTYASVLRRIINQLPTIVQRLLRRDELLSARLLFSFTADLPVTFPKLKAPTRAQQREAARK